MRKTIIFTVIAMCFTMVSVQANATTTKGEPLTSTKYFKVNSFCVSIALGDIETVQKLLELGEDVNQTSNGMTPIMYAAKYNRTEILKILIEKGANLKAKSDRRLTALQYAKLHGAIDAAAILKHALAKK
ncbi:ankyrin repeat domain-containing protein [Gaetbulibacter sp. M240]|uniref:ankyrin repeat domain-containing protein n=1 Tax=Gaetbulibacter sp. M240 TaxID=3126511 RepID=UPI00374F93BB